MRRRRAIGAFAGSPCDHELARRAVRRASLTALLLLAACMSASGGAGSAPAAPAATGPAAEWNMKTREHVDLWLHGYAMIVDDTAQISFFRAGYRDSMVVRKNRRAVTTLLDANRAQLRARFTSAPALFGSQFLALYFGSWEDVRRGADFFLRAQGDPGRATDPALQQIIAVFAGNFPTAADRAWLELFLTSLQDESDKFYHAYWLEQRQARTPVLTIADSLWRTVYYAKFRRYLNGTRQTRGDFLVSLPLQAEGRTVGADPTTVGSTSSAIAVGFPEQPAQAMDAIYVFAHEITSSLASSVVIDNITPAEQRSGLGDRYIGSLLVRGGAVLLSRVAPDAADGYARFYLAAAGLPAGGAMPQAALAAAFPLPDTIRDAFSRQLDVILGGI